MIPRTITVKYSCGECALIRREVTVKARERDEDLMDWMMGLQERIGLDHRLFRPNCKSTHMQDLMIPLNEGNDTFVGESPR